MRDRDKIVVVRDSEKPVNSTNTAMVAAFDKLGIKLDPDCAFLETREIIQGQERRQTTWVLKAQSEDGKYDTRKMIEAWNDINFARLNPTHPLAIMKEYHETHRRLLSVIRGMPPSFITRKGNRAAYIPADASPERRAELLGGLEK